MDVGLLTQVKWYH